MKKRVSTFIATVILCSFVLSQETWAIEFPDLGKLVEEAASGIADAATSAGAAISDVTGQAGKTVDDAINTAAGAADYVVDQADHVVEIASCGAGYVTSAVARAFQVLQESGLKIMKLVQDEVADLDLSKPESWDIAKKKVDEAIEKAFESRILNREKISEETAKIVTNIVFGAMMYWYQYSNGQITLGEYVSGMSEVLIRNGLPTGVGLIVSLLPIHLPNADSLAKEATYYLISKAYGDESGEDSFTP